MQHYTMNLNLKVWRQSNSKSVGRFENYQVSDVSSEMSFLEMIDVLNEKLIAESRVNELSLIEMNRKIK
jgi:succinate dehydrogenase / fumarate reductase iron-sulfur subunit